jgi:ubiquinone/menaquinone biosynthesis C-methylase UbiE
MLRERHFLKALPKITRSIAARHESKSPDVISIASAFGKEYFDGDRKFGYGGYHYDGRWRPIAKKIINEYRIKPEMRVLDVGCAKGFLLKDLILECPGLKVVGLDISEYALSHAESEIKKFLVLGTADYLPFEQNEFDLVISINTIHNLDRQAACTALGEIQRVSKNESYVVVDSYRNSKEKELFQKWVLTAKYHDFPDGWLTLFEKCGYTGDYEWTILEDFSE